MKIRAHFGSTNIELAVGYSQGKSIIERFQEGDSPIIVTNNKTHVDVSKAIAIEILTKEA